MKKNFLPVHLFLMYTIVYPSGTCQDAQPPYKCTPCPEREKGGVTSVAFIRKGFTFLDRTDPQEWITGIQSGQIIYIPRTRGSYDGGTPKYGPGYGRRKQRLLGYDYKLQFMDEDFKNNTAFYDAIDESNDWTFAFFTETLVWFSIEEVTISVKDPVQEDIETDVIWDSEITWFYKNKPLKVAAPVGIAEMCFTLEDSGSGSGE